MVPSGIQDVANIVIFVAPGYFAIQVYAALFSKDERDWSKIALESVALSLPLVGIYNYFWTAFQPAVPTDATSLSYVIPLVIMSMALSYGFGIVRRSKPVRTLAHRLGIADPDNDFIRSQFKKLGAGASVTVTLRDKEVFSAVPHAIETFKNGRSQKIVFKNLAWYVPGRKRNPWDERSGSLVISTDDILYIESEAPLKS